MITTNVNGNPISSGFISEIQSDSPDVIARFWYNNAELPCDIVNITVEKGSCGSNPFMIGEVIGDSLRAVVKNLTTPIKSEMIECHIGAMVSGEYEYISLGKYKVSEVKKTRYQSEITAYSGIVADSGNDFNNSGLNEPTIAELAVRLQSDLNCTISFDNGIDTTLPITAQLTEITDYQALQILAICCGGYAINTIDGNIVVKKYDATPTLEVDTGMMVNLPEIAEAEYRVRQIGVLVSDATVDNEGNEVEAVYYALDTQGYIKVVKQGTEYYLIDSQGNRIIADIRPETADIYFECAYMTEAMFGANIEPVVGYAYYPADINLTLGDPRLEGSDVLQVEEVDGSLYPVPCHKIIHKYDGGFTTEVKSAEASDESNSIGTEYPITQRLQNLDRKTGKAQATADNAYSIADNTNQYFWFTGTGTDTGAHITEIPQEQWDDPNSPYYHTGGNLLARSNGIAVRNGLTELATFGANGISLGQDADGKSRSEIGTAGMRIVQKVNGTDKQIANLGYGLGKTDVGGNANAPYYDLGIRLTNSDIGNYSVAEGLSAISSGYASHAEGLECSATGNYAHAEGMYSVASGATAHAEGYNTRASKQGAHAEGHTAHADGSNSHAEGFKTTASKQGGHAEGEETTASEERDHAEGYQTTASGGNSHAEGFSTTASAGQSHAEGNTTVASGVNTHAQNLGTIAQRKSQTALGEYNKADTTGASAIVRGSYVLIVGNGTSDNARSNAFAIDWNGNVKANGSVYAGCNADSTGGKKLTYDSGDSLNFTCSLASYLTSSSTEITVTVPLAKYITATGFTATSLQLCTRQNGQYTHGSSANTYATWTQSGATIYDGTLHLSMRNSDTTNAVNNAPIGILMKIQGSFT